MYTFETTNKLRVNSLKHRSLVYL